MLLLVQRVNNAVPDKVNKQIRYANKRMKGEKSLVSI